MSEPLFLGIDGGATRCRARIVDAAGAVLGEGSAGTANPRFGVAAAFAEIEQATGEALQAAGLPDDATGRLHAGLGLAGVGQAKDRAALLAHPHRFAALALETDAHAACLGAHDGGDGAILILGTGSCGWALIGGTPHRIGGLGFPISDQGSGASLGLAAIRQSLWAHDGVVAAGPLSAAVLARFGNDPEAAVAWMDTARPRDYAALAPLVIEHAEARDPMAVALMQQTGADAARMAEALLATGAPRLALMGGLAPFVEPWLPPPLRRLLVAPVGDALDGAILLARSAEKGHAA
ncbi:MAG: N-acetylglucosamine kinase [Inquilinus sp.]|nr:N-acetylglucosamine kinase [Inquilinus sp.]